jgi:hypothetical protein
MATDSSCDMSKTFIGAHGPAYHPIDRLAGFTSDELEALCVQRSCRAEQAVMVTRSLDH